MKLAMSAYAHAPVWIQNLLISAYGLRLRRLRYGRIGQEVLTRLRESRGISAEQLRQETLQTLSQVVAQAASDVPFYRTRGLPQTRFQSLDQLDRLPMLSKSEVQSAGRELISDRYRDRRLTEIHTGGTTGKPLAIYCDSATLQRNYAFFTRFKETIGITAGARVATFAGRTLVPVGAGQPYWRRNRAANTLLFSSYHIGPATLSAYVAALRDFAPELIDTYPSSIEPLARYVLDHDITSIRPRAVITSSETLFPTVRALIRRAFRCPVFDHYGSAEMAALITQCESGTYHVEPQFGVVEVLHEGRRVGPGERGEIVATGFINPVMPLIRYRMGDYAVRGSGQCACGRAGDTIERIEGRMDDVIVTPEGTLVGRLDPIFKSVASLYETRIVQDRTDHLRVEIVASDAFSRAMQNELEAQLRSRVGPTMLIDIVRVPSIERTAAGKLRTTVNLVHQQSSRPASESISGL
jgi:phenylacetate-coenzyme A ligase PaaK-like adenylate-forming protein